MALITEAYRQQQTKLHENEAYGVASLGWGETVARMLQRLKISTVLDYGAGKQRLLEPLRKAGWDGAYIAFDPAFPDIAVSPPHPVEGVVCIDVLEHIEPECLDDVLDDLQRLTGRFGLFTIATGPASKVLPDGRNAHLIQKDERFWLPEIMKRFGLLSFTKNQREIVVVVRNLR